MNFLDLQDFIQNKMGVSHIYQPVMLITLLEHGGPFLADSISGFPPSRKWRKGSLHCTFVTLAVKAGVHSWLNVFLDSLLSQRMTDGLGSWPALSSPSL